MRYSRECSVEKKPFVAKVFYWRKFSAKLACRQVKSDGLNQKTFKLFFFRVLTFSFMPDFEKIRPRDNKSQITINI